MSYSQFDDVLKLGKSPSKFPGVPKLDVGGPLKLHPGLKYIWPLRIQFSIIQSPENEHGPDTASRVGGVAEVHEETGKWSASVDIDPGKFRTGDARAVGVLVLEQVARFGFETLTWCDHV